MNNNSIEKFLTSYLYIWILGILTDPDRYRFKTIGLSADKLTIQQYCNILSEHLSPKIFQVS